jgi:hypothetical protein
MLSSDGLFDSPRPADNTKRARLEHPNPSNNDDNDNVLALLDEIDAVTATCDTFTTVCHRDDEGGNDPFGGHSIHTGRVTESDALVVGVDGVGQDTDSDRLLPFPFTADSDPLPHIHMNLEALGLLLPPAPATPLPNQRIFKIPTLHAFVLEYEQVGPNYWLRFDGGACGTCQGAVFRRVPCHYGLLMSLVGVTSYKGHLIVTGGNVRELYRNSHTISH